ncbi:hypothetical protein [Thermococcus piezophilus]|uniref:Uncharacterized protein n=1 Tax=Thermococcus piezophilus TaxID=1712654 RepID=A0A172WEV8_9EURY|nr:hypothetical protein [Thermococcus piezophilus]ANF21964.1 hypothetical protein A7C91_01225 [Thermococcus piezophilus]
MMLPFFRFFLRLPAIAFKVVGLIRVTNRAKRRFRGELLREGLPGEVVDELVEDFDPSAPLKDAFSSRRR